MTAMTNQSVIRQPRPSSLADVLDLILDKGLVIDAYVRVSLVGIELLTIDARVVVASVDTYLRFASMTNRLDLKNSDNAEGLPQLMHDMVSGGASDKTKGALSGAADQVSSWLQGGQDDAEDQDEDQDEDSRRRQPARSRGRRPSGDDERPSRRPAYPRDADEGRPRRATAGRRRRGEDS